MLLRFSVENVLCFAAEATFSMIASADDSHPSHILPGSEPTQPSVLRATALYGANAHGKTSFVSAIDILKEIVIDDATGSKLKKYKLSRSYLNKPSRFSIEFRVGGDDYEYGLVVSKTHIDEEWLFVKGAQTTERKIFERLTTANEEEGFVTKASFGTEFRRGKYKNTKHTVGIVLEIVAESIPPGKTLLNEAYSRDVSEIKAAFDWFVKTLTPISATSTYRPLFERAKSDKSFVRNLSRFLKNADVGITAVHFEEGLIEAASLPDSLRSEVTGLDVGEMLIAGGEEGAELAIERTEKGEIVGSKLVSHRRGDRNQTVSFEAAEESAGTRRLFDLLPMTMSNKERPRVYVVDELDRKLHPLLTRALIETFFKNGRDQLIFTTHNTFLMDLSLLRADEIWFVQKKKEGNSELYSLSDLKINENLDVRRGYLNGRFGAVPFTGDIEALGWTRKS